MSLLQVCLLNENMGDVIIEVGPESVVVRELNSLAEAGEKQVVLIIEETAEGQIVVQLGGFETQFQ